MKTTIQIRTGDFEYIMQEFDNDVSPERAVELFNELKKANQPQEGVTVRAFRDALDEYLKHGTGNTELFQSMSRVQQNCFNEIKLSNKRINKIEE